MPERWRVRRWMLRGLGLTHAVAFSSLFVQLPGLIGERGIAPASDTLRAWSELQAEAARHHLPTVFWLLGTTDAALLAVCGAGISFSALLIAGIAPSLMLSLLWLAYLSLCSVGSVFLGYQWDALLLEASFAGIWLAPGQWLPRDAARVRTPSLAFWLMRVLLCRLMWLSGFSKLASGDPAWRSLEALHFHFFTQPLPTWTSVFAHELPDALLRIGTAATLAIELALPLLALGPRPARLFACAGFAALQLAIALTGNYGFFNLLTLVLCFSLLEDRDLAAVCRGLGFARPGGDSAAREPGAAALPLRRIAETAAGLLLALSLARSAAQIAPGSLPDPLLRLLGAAAPFRSSNAYGLFAVMTTQRPEIEIELSSDGQHWRPLEFRFKPGALTRWPPLALVHMPRLDWQLWFAALQGCERAAWFSEFAAQLLRGSRPVWSLVGEAPPEPAAALLRSTLYLYRFASPRQRERTGEVWERERVGSFCPTLRFEGGPRVGRTRR